MTWYLGKPGALQQIRPPARDYDRTADDNPTTVELLNGRAVQRRPRALGTYAYQWNWLERNDWRTIKAVASGQYGPGPYALIDGSTANYLTPAQASGDASGFSAEFGALSTVDTPVMLGRSVEWVIPGSSDTVETYTDTVAFAEDSITTIAVPGGVTSMKIDLSDPTAGDNLDIYQVLDPDGVSQGSSSTGGTSAESVTIANPVAGQWQIDVYAASVAGSVANYTLTVTYTSSVSGTPVLSAPHPVWQHGYPTPVGASWTFAVWAQASVDTSVTAALVWYDASGTQISESTAATTVPGSAWTRVPVTGTAPAGAAYAAPEIRVPSDPVTVYIGQARLALDDSAEWYPGEGLPAVSVTSLQESVPIHDKRTVQLTLTEVA